MTQEPLKATKDFLEENNLLDEQGKGSSIEICVKGANSEKVNGQEHILLKALKDGEEYLHEHPIDNGANITGLAYQYQGALSNLGYQGSVHLDLSEF